MRPCRGRDQCKRRGFKLGKCLQGPLGKWDTCKLAEDRCLLLLDGGCRRLQDAGKFLNMPCSSSRLMLHKRRERSSSRRSSSSSMLWQLRKCTGYLSTRGMRIPRIMTPRQSPLRMPPCKPDAAWALATFNLEFLPVRRFRGSIQQARCRCNILAWQVTRRRL